MPEHQRKSSQPMAAELSVWHRLLALLRIRVLQLSGLVVLLTGVGALAFEVKYCVLDADIGWHLKVGDWIIAHGALPHTGILSRTAANRPWVAYSWGYEVLLSRAYDWFGLVGVGLFGTLLTLAIAGAVFWMLLRLSGRFWLALGLTAVVCWLFLFIAMPRPLFFSAALFAVTLTLILEANRTGRIQTLYWLPAIFVVWANLHIQFVYGLFLLGLLVSVSLAQRLANRFGFLPDFLFTPKLFSSHLIILFGVCILATMVGPNFYHPYQVAYEYSKARFPYSFLVEQQPLSFQAARHYITLLLTGAAFYAVGWQKKLDPYKLAVLIVASLVAYRAMRDIWFICIPAAACIADFPAQEPERDQPANWLEKAAVLAVVAICLAVLSPLTHFNQRGLDQAIRSQYPVNAVDFLRQNPQPGPLYNNFSWGGFLAWYLPEYPVAIDGRTDLYGDELDQMFFTSEIATQSPGSDPYLNEAGVVLLSSQLPLAKTLTADPRYHIAFRDEIAIVFTRREDPP